MNSDKAFGKAQSEMGEFKAWDTENTELGHRGIGSKAREDDLAGLMQLAKVHLRMSRDRGGAR